MERDDFLEAIGGIRTWSRHSERAPYKPLLLLLALGRLAGGEHRLASYEAELRGPLSDLWYKFGPPRAVGYLVRPFWRLQKDGDLWEVPGNENVPLQADGDPAEGDLIGKGIRGGFSEPAFNLLKNDPWLVQETAKQLLHTYFAQSLHNDIRLAVGLPVDGEAWVAPRDPDFHEKVLHAYQSCCAVCDFDIRLDEGPLGLESTHIQWHAYGGPDEVANGLALCAMHHKALDRGALSLMQGNADRCQIIVSRRVAGQSRAAKELRDLHGKPLRLPEDSVLIPASEYIDWHRKEVFRNGTIS